MHKPRYRLIQVCGVDDSTGKPSRWKTVQNTLRLNRKWSWVLATGDSKQTFHPCKYPADVQKSGSTQDNSLCHTILRIVGYLASLVLIY